MIDAELVARLREAVERIERRAGTPPAASPLAED
jgi:hypothetical protein